MVGFVAKLAICDECIELCYEILTETRLNYEIVRTWCPIEKWTAEELIELMRFCIEQKDTKVTTLLLPEGQTLILYKGEEAKTAGQVGRLIEAINARKNLV